jgi:carboxyl-terminal processing protease
MMRAKSNLPLFILILVVGVFIGTQIDKIVTGENLSQSLRKLSDVISLTQRYYIHDVSSQQLVESAIKGLLDDLDPHTVYIPEKDFKQVEESFRGDFEGIGIEFQIVNDTITVVTPISGGPSEQLGIQPGDRIIEIENKPVIGITNDQVRQKLRGKAGTKVSIKVLRPSSGKTLDYLITRDKIPIYSVDAAFMVNKDLGYISISRFSETTFDEVLKALDKLSESGMRKILLDLRGNPGGYLNQAVQIADLFLDKDKKIVYTRGRIKEFDEEYYASNTYKYENYPLVILLNRGSASASEIVAGAIQDWDRGLIVGETSFGKGLVQRQFELEDNSAIRLTISEYFTPSGRNIQRDFNGKKSKKDYLLETLELEDKEGENFFHQNERDSSKPVFNTIIKKRKIYGGGGVTPDYIVKNEELSELTQNLLKDNLFYSFTLNYLDSNAEKIKSNFGDDLNAFRLKFSVDETLLNSFLNFVRAKKIVIKENELQADLSYIKNRLKAQIARYFWKNEGWYSVLLDSDNQYTKAVSLFDLAETLIRK